MSINIPNRGQQKNCVNLLYAWLLHRIPAPAPSNLNIVVELFTYFECKLHLDQIFFGLKYFDLIFRPEK